MRTSGLFSTLHGSIIKLSENFVKNLPHKKARKRKRARHTLLDRVENQERHSESLEEKIENQRKTIENQREKIEKLKYKTTELRENLISCRESLKAKSDLQKSAARYLSLYRQGLLSDEIAKSNVNFSADCYLSLLPSTIPAALQLKRAYGGRVVCDCVENVDLEKQSLAPNMHPPTLELCNLAAYGALSVCDKLMTVGNSLGRTLERFDRPFLVLPNYRNFEEPEPAGTLRAQCGLTEDDLLLFASGNVVVGFEPVLEALARLPDNVHLAALVQLRPSSYKSEVRARIDQLGLAKRIHFFPFVPYDQLASIIADADVGLITSDTANPNGAVALPNRLFDYLTGGLPVIAPPMPDVVALLDKHGFGCHLPEVTANDWEITLRKVLADLPGYRSAAQRARREICWENNEDVLFEFLGRPKRLTMLGFRDLSRYQRFQRIAASLARRGTQIRAVFYSTDPLPTKIDNAEFYHFAERHGDGPGLRLVQHADAEQPEESAHA